MKISKKILLASIITISALVGAVYAVAFITQTFPAVTIPPVQTSPATITSTCSGGAAGSGSLVLESTPTGDSGALVFDCGGLNPAFTVTFASGKTSLTATPTFTISITGSGTAILGIEGFTFPCPSTTNSPITSGTATTFSSQGFYQYCLTYSGFDGAGGTIGTFTVTWA